MSEPTSTKARILCLDDEPNVLKALALHLRRHFEVETAPSGAEALAILKQDNTFAMVLSDMRMPGMDGATFLRHARELVPDTVRVLLTGQTDIESAISAVNEGQIFRFLTKPCPPPALLAAISAAVDQHRLITAERVLLEQTLHGSIKVMTDVLALVSPISFGRATRVKQLVSELAEKLALRERWQVEVAAMLSQLGYITLPPDTAERVYFGRPLSADERALVARLPALTESLLGNIPRLEPVREILARHTHHFRAAPPEHQDERTRIVERGAEILKVAVDFDALDAPESEALGETSAGAALEVLRGRTDRYDPEVLQALVAIRGRAAPVTEILELHDGDLRVGMVLAEDVKMPSGALLVARGYEVTDRFLERIRNFPPETKRKGVWRVLVRGEASAVL